MNSKIYITLIKLKFWSQYIYSAGLDDEIFFSKWINQKSCGSQEIINMDKIKILSFALFFYCLFSLKTWKCAIKIDHINSYNHNIYN